jgi:hypothetical protein
MIAISIIIIHCLAFSSTWSERGGPLMFICSLALEMVLHAVCRICVLTEV